MIFTCVDELPPIVGFDFCDPKFKFGEIEGLIISPVSMDDGDTTVTVYPADESSATDWEPLLADPAETDILAVTGVAFYLTVRGTLSEPDQTVIEASGNRKAYPPAEYTIEARVDDLSDTVYEGLALLNNRQCRLWFIAGGHIFGGNTGQSPVSLNTFAAIEEGFDTMHNVHIRATWKADRMPPRAIAPDFEALTAVE